MLHSLKQSSWQPAANAGITGCEVARSAAHARPAAPCREMSSSAGGRRSALLVPTTSRSADERVAGGRAMGLVGEGQHGTFFTKDKIANFDSCV